MYFSPTKGHPTLSPTPQRATHVGPWGVGKSVRCAYAWPKRPVLYNCLHLWQGRTTMTLSNAAILLCCVFALASIGLGCACLHLIARVSHHACVQFIVRLSSRTRVPPLPGMCPSTGTECALHMYACVLARSHVRACGFPGIPTCCRSIIDR